MEETQKIILGLDLSLNSTGYAILNMDGELIEKDIIKAKQRETHHQKIKRQYDVLAGIKDKYSDKEYDMIVVKEQLLFRPPRTASILAKIHGIIDLLFPEVFEYYPSTIKKDITGNGKADKQEVADAVCKHLDMTEEELAFKSDDESDAIAVALMYLITEAS